MKKDTTYDKTKIWVTKDKRMLPIVDIEDSHLINILKYTISGQCAISFYTENYFPQLLANLLSEMFARGLSTELCTSRQAPSPDLFDKELVISPNNQSTTQKKLEGDGPDLDISQLSEQARSLFEDLKRLGRRRILLMDLCYANELVKNGFAKFNEDTDYMDYLDICYGNTSTSRSKAIPEDADLLSLCNTLLTDNYFGTKEDDPTTLNNLKSRRILIDAGLLEPNPSSISSLLVTKQIRERDKGLFFYRNGIKPKQVSSLSASAKALYDKLSSRNSLQITLTELADANQLVQTDNAYFQKPDLYTNKFTYLTIFKKCSNLMTFVPPLDDTARIDDLCSMIGSFENIKHGTFTDYQSRAPLIETGILEKVEVAGFRPHLKLTGAAVNYHNDLLRVREYEDK